MVRDVYFLLCNENFRLETEIFRLYAAFWQLSELSIFYVYLAYSSAFACLRRFSKSIACFGNSDYSWTGVIISKRKFGDFGKSGNLPKTEKMKGYVYQKVSYCCGMYQYSVISKIGNLIPGNCTSSILVQA